MRDWPLERERERPFQTIVSREVVREREVAWRERGRLEREERVKEVFREVVSKDRFARERERERGRFERERERCRFEREIDR